MKIYTNIYKIQIYRYKTILKKVLGLRYRTILLIVSIVLIVSMVLKVSLNESIAFCDTKKLSTKKIDKKNKRKYIQR